MGIRQKFSLAAASILPVVALAAYFLFSPAQATAASCEFHAPCGSGGCQSGAGYCWPNGSNNGIYVFCAGDGNAGGPGVCNNGCVTCTDGPR